MTYADKSVIGSVVIVIISVVFSLNKKLKHPELKNNGAKAAYAILLIISGILVSGDQLLLICLMFSFIAALGQPILADPYLLKRTLRYTGENGGEKTPFWMLYLWVVALTQLSYFGARIDSILSYFGFNPTLLLKNAVFFTVGLTYFYAFEWLVGNYLKWWTRRNCSQPFGVATYAILSEATLVAMLGPLSFLLKDPSYTGILGPACVASILFASVFTFYCRIFYKPSIE